MAIALGVASLLILASLAGFDPADPPTDSVYPPHRTVHNWCGPVGATLSAGLVGSMGIGSWFVGVVAMTVAWNVFRRSSMRENCRRAVGLLLLIPTSLALLQRASAVGDYTSIYGSGGSLGFLIARFLEGHLSHLGSFLILTSVFGIGCLFVFDAALLQGGSWLVRVSASSLRVLAVSAWRLRPVRKPMEAPAAADLVALKIASEDDHLQEAVEESQEEPWEHPDQELKIVRTGFTAAETTDSEEETSDDDEEALEDVEEVEAEADEYEDEAEEYQEELEPAAYQLPDVELLDDVPPFEFGEHEQEIRERAKILEKTLAEFQMKVKVVQIDTGPVVTQYEIELEAGLRSRKVMAAAEDLAIALKAPNVRIVAPIPGKNTVGIEVPNERRAKVGLKEVMHLGEAQAAKMRLPLFLGKDVKGQPMVFDLANMPHLLIAGRTGTGKSVCLNALILSIAMTRTPAQVKMLMIDPKMVELSLYKDIPHLLHPVVTDMKKAEALLAWAVDKMEERYDLLARCGVRHIDAYNKLSHNEVLARLGPMADEDKQHVPEQMPYILIFADEMADLIMTAAKEVEAHIIRLAQKSRAVGIHLILATQKPTVDVITGLIKSNLPARIAFQVASRTDSRVVLDEMGAEKLLGNGDMLFLYPGTSKITRAQGTFISDEEVAKVTAYLASQGKPQFSPELANLESAGGKSGGLKSLSERDPLYEQAIDVIVHEQRGSVSLLQRALGVGYGRGARLIDFMAEDGIVGQFNGSQAREVLYSPEEWSNYKRAHFDAAG